MQDVCIQQAKVFPPTLIGKTNAHMLHPISLTAAALLCLAMAFFCTPVYAFHKCEINGTVTYQQTPCPSNHIRKQPTTEELNAAQNKQRAASALPRAEQPLGTPESRQPLALPTKTPDKFTCDGRRYCSQMTSCAEAKFFLANCPGVKMDGGKANGIPCEQQWCTH